MASPVLVFGGEHGTLAGFNLGNGGNRLVDALTGTAGTHYQIIAGAARSGAFGLRYNANSGKVGWSTSTIGSGKTVLVGVEWFRWTASQNGDFVFISTSANIDTAGFFIDGTGTLTAYNGGTQTCAQATASGTFHRIDFRLDVTVNPIVLDWSVNGIAQTSISRAVAATTISAYTHGANSGSSSTDVDADDLLLSVTSADYPLGSHKIPAALTVDTGGTLTVSGSTVNFNTFAGAAPTLTAWNATTARGAIDELPITVGSSQDGFAQVNTAASDYVEVPMTTYTLATGETVTGVRMLAPLWAQSTTANALGLRSFNGTTETSLFSGDPNADNSSTPAWCCKMLTQADFDTQTELDALAFRVGFSSNAGVDVGIHAIYAEVAVKESTASTVALTPATFTFSAVAVTATPQPVTVVLTVATFAFSAVAVTATPGAVTQALTPATFTFSAVAVTATPGLVTQALTPATFTFDAVAVVATPVAVTQALTVATFAFDAVPVAATAGVVTVALTPAVFTFTGVAVNPVPDTGTVMLAVATFTFDAVPVAAAPQAVTVALIPAVFTFSAVPVLAAPAIAIVNLVPAVFTFVAVPLGLPSGSVRDMILTFGTPRHRWTIFAPLRPRWTIGPVRRRPR